MWQGSWLGEFPSHRGVNTLLIDPFRCSVQESRRFDTYASEDSARQLSDYLRQLSKGSVLVGVSADEPTDRLSSALPALRELAVNVDDVGLRGSFAFIAQIGYPDKTVLSKALTQQESLTSPAHVIATITGINFAGFYAALSF